MRKKKTTTWELPTRGDPIVERWVNLVNPEEGGSIKMDHMKCIEFLQDQAGTSDHTAREWFYIMKTDFEYELKRKNPEATQGGIMLNALAKLYKERAPKEKRYR